MIVPLPFVELAVDYNVSRISDLVIRAEHMLGSQVLEVIWPKHE